MWTCWRVPGTSYHTRYISVSGTSYVGRQRRFCGSCCAWDCESEKWNSRKYSRTAAVQRLYRLSSMSISPPSQDVKHEIKRDPRGNTTVTDLTMEHVDPNDGEGVEEIMQVPNWASLPFFFFFDARSPCRLGSVAIMGLFSTPFVVDSTFDVSSYHVRVCHTWYRWVLMSLTLKLAPVVSCTFHTI